MLRRKLTVLFLLYALFAERNSRRTNLREPDRADFRDYDDNGENLYRAEGND